MEIIESISWVAIGFVPTLALLQIYDKLRKGRRKEIVSGLVTNGVMVKKVPTLITLFIKQLDFPF
jgi:hypothetical protein